MPTAPHTFVQVAPDCSAERGTAPASKREPPPTHVVQFALLIADPYRYTNEELILEVFARRQGLGGPELESSRGALRDELFSRPHPCMRASMLPKKFGWGVHSDSGGRLALYARESESYQRLVDAGRHGELTLTYAMRNKRARPERS